MKDFSTVKLELMIMGLALYNAWLEASEDLVPDREGDTEWLLNTLLENYCHDIEHHNTGTRAIRDGMLASAATFLVKNRFDANKAETEITKRLQRMKQLHDSGIDIKPKRLLLTGMPNFE